MHHVLNNVYEHSIGIDARHKVVTTPRSVGMSCRHMRGTPRNAIYPHLIVTPRMGTQCSLQYDTFQTELAFSQLSKINLCFLFRLIFASEVFLVNLLVCARLACSSYLYECF